MNRTVRAAMLVTALLAALAFAGSAFASFAPKLLAKHAASGVSVSVSVGNNDDPTAKVSIYVPSGYTLNPPALGTKLGDVSATASAADLGGAVLPLTGELDSIAQSSLTAAQQASEQLCLGGATPAAIWDMHLTAAGQTLDIPLYVLPTSGVEATAGAAKIVVCLPPPDVPASNPNRAVFGAKLLSASFTTSGLTPPSSNGDFRWTSLWTPYTPGAGTPNAAGSVEAQSIVHSPIAAGLKVTRSKLTSFKTVKVKGKNKRVKIIRTQVKWSASATANGQAAGGATFVTTRGVKKIGTTSGSFILLKGTSATLATTATVPDQDLGAAACVASPIFQGVPCVAASAPGGTAKATARVTAYTR
jgi:hypothetical protein